MVRTARYKYALYNWGRYREQLFDLANDPGEKSNLAGKPESGKILEEHRRRLYEWIGKTDDPFTYHYAQPHAGPQFPGSEFSSRHAP